MIPEVERRNGAHANIVLVTGSLQSGGAERVLSGMANFWAEKGWTVTVVSWSGPHTPDFYSLNSAVKRVWLDDHATSQSNFAKLRSTFRCIRRFRKLILELNPDVVLSFIDISNVLTLISTMGLKTHVVVSVRNNPASSTSMNWPWKVLRRVFYGRASAVVAQTHDAARWIEKRCRVKADVIANPLRHLPNIATKRELIILAVGRLSKEKGFDLLLRSFAKVRGDFENWRLVIIGSGPERSNLLELAEELNLTSHMEVRGPTRGVETWMSRAGLVVQPSRYEGFPNVILEAMGMGAAVISANCPWGPSEIILDGVNGRLVPTEDVDALALAMEELMSQPAIRRELGSEAKKVRETFRQEKIMAEWERCVLRRTPA